MSKLKGVRFAPSPTGPFHIGNLRTAWISERLARRTNEPWIVRVEDIDQPRVVTDAWNLQRADLAELSLYPDEVVTQSNRHDRHLELFLKARREGLIYPCDCSRRDVLESLSRMATAPHEPTPEYSGRCRNRPKNENYQPVETLAWRWRSAETSGHHDLIVARSDIHGKMFVPGYNWACAIDDADGSYRLLVRAWDLLSVEKIQNEIRMWVSPNSRETKVFHTALIVQPNGRRLEKRTQGVTLAELKLRGISVNGILERFVSSFDENKTENDGLEFGEKDRTMTLDQLRLND